MLTQVARPSFYSKNCFEFSAKLDLSAFDVHATPVRLGIPIPNSLSAAVPKRQAEYIAGRFAAFSALKLAGFNESIDLTKLPDGSPSWPKGYTGSITHTNDYVSAVVASVEHLRSLGRDTERILVEKTASEIEGHALRPEEVLRQKNSQLTVGEYTGLIFSAKESLYKALSPIVQKYFGFQSAETIAITQHTNNTGRLTLRLTKPLNNEFQHGHEFEIQFEILDQIHTLLELQQNSKQH